MRTELYKMWVNFCRKQTHGLMTSDKMKCPLPEYDAWNAFYLAKDSNNIVKFIVKNFNLFREWFPISCVFFDLHQIDDPSKVLTAKCKRLLKDFKKALREDSLAIDRRKKKKEDV